MNESIRTMVFVGAATLAGLIAWISQPVPPAPPASGGAQIFPPFEATDANRFKIVQYEEQLGELNTFEVAKENGRWVIPSHDNYPADAAEQLKNIAGLFVELKAVGPPMTMNRDDHELYGVREPEKGAADPKGFGRLVTISDKADRPLVELIVGKKAESNASAGEMGEQKEYHFVRRVGQDPVYVVEMSLAALTTKFEEWIERDLLNLNPLDVAKLDLRDYSIVPVGDPNDPTSRTMALLRRMDTLASWNATENNWSLEKMTIYRGNDALEGQLADDEELNKAKLDGVKTAIDDLKIIDVERKPQALADALKDDKLARDRAAVQELGEHGFFVMPGERGSQPQILGSNGGLRITMKDGVQYALNFGNAKGAEKGDSTKLNRYLMITAQLDESMLPKPELEPEPATVEPPADEPASSESGDEEEADDAPQEQAEGEKAADEKAEPDEKAADDAAAVKERERVKKENQRKLDAYQEKRRQAEGRVAELNARFGNWFYVVSDDMYKKVQLGRADIVKDRETAKDEGFGVDAFRKLESDGLEGKPQPAGSALPMPPSLPGFNLP
jgi:hypothetical protein